MDKIVVEGGARLVGEIPISGAKNAALPLLAAALLPSGALDVQECPAAAGRADDGQKLLRRLGWTVDAGSPSGASRRTLASGAGSSLTISPPTAKKLKLEAPYDLVKTMRAAFLVLGPLLARRAGHACRNRAVARSARARSTST